MKEIKDQKEQERKLSTIWNEFHSKYLILNWKLLKFISTANRDEENSIVKKVTLSPASGEDRKFRSDENILVGVTTGWKNEKIIWVRFPPVQGKCVHGVLLFAFWFVSVFVLYNIPFAQNDGSRKIPMLLHSNQIIVKCTSFTNKYAHIYGDFLYL